MPPFTTYHELIGACERERNACYPNNQSMALIFQLDADPLRNQSKRQELWARIMNFIDFVFVKIDL